MFNRATGLGLDEPATEELVDETLDFLEGTRSYVSVAPDARPAELATWLQARGLTPGYGWTKFGRPATDPPEAQTALRIERVESGEAFGAAAAGGFEVPELSVAGSPSYPRETAGTASSRSTETSRPERARST